MVHINSIDIMQVLR